MGIGSNSGYMGMNGWQNANGSTLADLLTSPVIQQYLAPANEQSVVDTMLNRADANAKVNVPTIAQLFPALSNLSMSAPQTMNVGQGQFGAGRFLQGLPALQTADYLGNAKSNTSGLLNQWTSPATYAQSSKA